MSEEESNKKHLLTILLTGSLITTTQAAAKLSVAPRHIRRLITQLREQGHPIEQLRQGRHIRYRIPPEHLPLDTKEPPSLDTTEALAISVAAGAAYAFLHRTPLSKALQSGFSKLVEYYAPAVDLVDLERLSELWYFQTLAHMNIDKTVFTNLLQAMNENRSILMDYDRPGRGLDVDRRVDPLGFGVIGNTVLLAAYCHRRSGVRDFSLARIQAVQVCDPQTDRQAYFSPPDMYDTFTHFTKGRFAVMAGGDVLVYRIRVAASHTHLFQERDYHHSQDIEHEEEDGSLIVSFEGASFEEFRSFFQGWGTAITVLEPIEMITRLREDARILATRYSSAS